MLDILSGDMTKGIKVQTKHLEALIELHNMTVAFAKNIQHLFSESDLQALQNTLKAVYSPYESYKQRCIIKPSDISHLLMFEVLALSIFLIYIVNLCRMLEFLVCLFSV